MSKSQSRRNWYFSTPDLCTSFFFFFFRIPHGMRDLSSLTRMGTQLHCRVLTTEPSRRSLECVSHNRTQLTLGAQKKGHLRILLSKLLHHCAALLLNQPPQPSCTYSFFICVNTLRLDRTLSYLIMAQFSLLKIIICCMIII